MTIHSPKTQQQIEAELVNTYLKYSRLSAFCAFGLVLYLGLSFYGTVAFNRILLWMLLVFLIDVVGILSSKSYQVDFSLQKTNFYKQRQHLLHFLVGIAWGLAYFILLDNLHTGEDAYRIVVSLVVVSTLSACTMSASITGLVAFVFPISAFSLVFFLANLPTYLWWALGGVALSAMTIFFGWVTHKFIVGQTESIVLSDNYNQNLEALNKKIEETNFKLVMRNQELIDMQAKLEILATHDDLTGLFGRRYILQRLSDELPQAKRHQQAFCLVMMDVDYFKQINDSYGHAAGDDVLRTIAQLLERELRQGDLIARYGGEEFLILLPMTELAAAKALVERLREQVAAQNFQFENQSLSVTASFGLTTLMVDDNADKMIDRADKAMFEAKHAGRNRVIVNTGA